MGRSIQKYPRMPSKFEEKQIASMVLSRELYPPHVVQAVGWIEQNYAQQNPLLSAMAKDLRVSRCYLGQLIIKHTGLTFRQHLKKVRMERAVQLLHNPGATVKEVAWQSGYGRVNNFVRDFREYHGLTPSTVRIAQAKGDGR